MADVILHNVAKSFGEATALRDVSLQCADGDLVVVFGPPRAGKSTLLRIVAGLTSLDAGDVGFNGASQNGVPAHRRDVAMAFKSYALYPHFTVRQNMAFPLRAPKRRIPAREIERRIQEVARLLDIVALLDRFPHQLSGGQKQRTSLGRALVRQCNVTLLDEPLAHLDAQLRSTLRSDLRFFLKENRLTTLYATPDFQEGFGIANRVVVLIDGVVHQEGEPNEIFARPADIAVAALVGDPAMALLPIDASGVVSLGQGRSVRPPRPEARYVGLRSRAVRIQLDGAIAEGAVTLVERVGASTLADIDLGSLTVVARLPDGSRVRVDERVPVAFDWNEACFFDVTGKRLDITALGPR